MFRIGRNRLIVLLLGIMFICFGLGTLITYASNGWSFNFAKHAVTADDTKVSDIQNIKEIIIEISSADISIITEDRTDVKAVLSGSILSSSEVMKPELILSKSSDRLSIELKSQKKYWGPTSIDLKVAIFLPKDYAENLTLDTSSGDINLNSRMSLKDVNLSLSSGDINITDLSCDKLEYDSSSGSLNAVTLNTKSTTFDLSSGDISINNFTGDIKGEVSSGEITVLYTSFNNNVDLHASSGDINLKLPENAEFNIDAETSSGDVECQFPVTLEGKQKRNSVKGTVKSATNKVILSASSGDLTVSH
jgi:lia operon protein LiaG